MTQMRQLAALGKKIRVPQARMNEILARSLPTLKGLKDERAHRDRMYNLSKEEQDLARQSFAYEKSARERALKQNAKDARKARQLMYGKLGTDLALGVGGAYLGSDDTTEEVINPVLETLPNVTTDVGADTLSEMTDKASSLWSGESPVEFEKPSFISDNVEPVTEGAGEWLKKFAGDVYSNASDLYSNTVGKLFDFEFDF